MLDWLAEGTASELAFTLGFATVGLVPSLRQPANPTGRLFAAAGLSWALTIRRRMVVGAARPVSPCWWPAAW